MSRMPEAEVSLRLAIWLISKGHAVDRVEVAIDGAQVQTSGAVHFNLQAFLEQSGWAKTVIKPGWQSEYSHPGWAVGLRIHSNPGKGDVVAPLRDGKLLRVECKKGPLERSSSSQEYPLLREALGQLLTIETIQAQDVLAVAVPHSPKFVELATRWRSAPLIQKFGIQILTVAQDGEVAGFARRTD